jgi:hypothetical protein
MDGWMDGRIHLRTNGLIEGWTDGWMDELTVGGWMDGRID